MAAVVGMGTVEFDFDPALSSGLSDDRKAPSGSSQEGKQPSHSAFSFVGGHDGVAKKLQHFAFEKAEIEPPAALTVFHEGSSARTLSERAAQHLSACTLRFSGQDACVLGNQLFAVLVRNFDAAVELAYDADLATDFAVVVAGSVEVEVWPLALPSGEQALEFLHIAGDVASFASLFGAAKVAAGMDSRVRLSGGMQKSSMFSTMESLELDLSWLPAVESDDGADCTVESDEEDCYGGFENDYRCVGRALSALEL